MWCGRLEPVLQSSLPSASSYVPNHMVLCNNLGSQSSVTDIQVMWDVTQCHWACGC